MKLVETDTALAGDDAPEVSRPPRPEHRKAYVSLFLTGAVLIGTVAIVYLLFPKRDNVAIDVAIAAHRAPGAADLDKPSGGELAAWTLGVLARPVEWPSGPGVVALGAERLEILHKPAAVVHFQVSGDVVTVLAIEPWEAVSRTIRVTDGDELAVWWRRDRVTLIAVGPASHAERWRAAIGAP